MENQVSSNSHATNDIGRTLLSLGAILSVVFAFWQMQNSAKEELRPELTELRRDIRSIEEKVNIMVGQQDSIMRRLNMGK